jgi:hypothetical protein
MKTNIAIVMHHLMRQKTLTSQQAWHRWNITRLADVIHELRTRYGLNIQTEMIRSGNTRYARYRFGGFCK